jgi:hypothetical protein
MAWRRIFHNEPDPKSGDTPGTPADSNDTETPQRAIPPHLAERLGVQHREPGGRDDLHRRLTRLRNQFTATLYDIEQGELAIEDDNPWKHRIALLSEALETVEADYAQEEAVVPGPFHPVPPTPIVDVNVTVESDVATVRYAVGGEKFVYEEPLDWAERGHQIARTELSQVAGEPAAVMPADVPEALRETLLHHLDHSLFVLATVLRDRTLDEEPLPEGLTLADLARPCPTCGGWTDYRGRCQNCARRQARLHELFRERDRLLNERASEIEEQHRIAERLPLARRRLADVEAELAALEAKIAEAENG